MAADGTMFHKIWRRHVVSDLGDGFALIHVDRHILHDLCARSFATLERRGFTLRNPELTFAVADHSVSTDPATDDPNQDRNPDVRLMRDAAAKYGFTHFDVGQPGHGIVHVMAPEQGLSLPGFTVACADSHTCTNGALGALAWGVGSGELLHILATQTGLLRIPQTMRVTIDGRLHAGVTGKDIILYLIGKLGAAGGNGYAVEYAGSAIRALPMEGRLTLCNMSVEWGARFGFVAPDDTT